MRLTSSVLVVLAAVVLATVAAAAPQLTINRDLRIARPTLMLQLSEVQRSQEFSSLLLSRKVNPDRQAELTKHFRSLPPDLQEQVLINSSTKFWQAAGEPNGLSLSANAGLIAKYRDISRFLLKIRLDELWPAQGTPGQWSFAMGAGFSANCKVRMDGTQLETNYMPYDEFFPRSLAFKIPAGTARGTNHNIDVINTANSETTAVLSYRIVAPRSYRGYFGWQFANFGDPTIPWNMYRNYFGAANVEYANGTHRPGAQSFYDSAYKGAGGGGNCFGMSVSSLRYKNGQMPSFWQGWFANAANHQSYLWWYPWRTETKQTVQEYQGAWYTQEILDAHTSLYNSQSPRDLYTRAQTLIASPTNKPVLVVWGTGWGHAVVPYKTEAVGDDRRIIVWDNNNPYRENESGSVDPNMAHVAYAANTFAYGSAPKGVMMSYNEVAPAVPHLPGAEYGGPGSSTAVVILSEGTKADQITDQAGRRFFNADGTPNQDPNTRIPNSMQVFPLVDGPPPSIPNSYPGIFVFRQAQGLSLNFALAKSPGAKRFNLYTNGRVFSLQANGAGQIQAQNLLQPGQALAVPNPEALQPFAFDIMRTQGAGDRVFELRNPRNLGTEQLRFNLAPDGSSLELQGGKGSQFDINVRGLVGQGEQQIRFGGLIVQGGLRAVVAPTNWGNLQSSRLQLQFRNLQNNALQGQQQIMPMP